MSPPSPDQVMSQALMQATAGAPLRVERHDGHVSAAELMWWLRDPEAAPPWDCRVLDLVTRQPVLDVGCATGRHVELLRARGVAAVGIDTCPEAVELGRAAGQPCDVADVWRYDPGEEFGTVLAMGGNLGIAGSVRALPAFLTRLESLLASGGCLLLGSVDWRLSAQLHHDFLAVQQREGRYPGDIWLRLRLGEAVSSWFAWVLVDRDALAFAATHVGLAVTDVVTHHHHYVAQLARRDQQ